MYWISEKARDRLASINSWLLIALIFAIPISTAGQNLLLLLILILFLVEGRFKEKWNRLKGQPLFWAFLAYLLIYPISLLWTDNIDWGLHIIQKHFKYILFPILLTIVKREHFHLYIGAFILAMAISEWVSYLVFFELITLEGVSSYNPTPFMSHIPYNPLLAFAIFILLDKLLYEDISGFKKLLVVGFVITMIANMFITGGRAGQVVFFILMLSLLAYYSYSKGFLFKGLLVSISSLLVVFSIAYNSSTIFHDRVNLAINEVMSYDANAHGSVSYRIHFVLNSLEVIKNEPMLGTGIGDYPDEYAKINAINTPSAPNTVQPHNQYIFEWASLGIFGLLTLLLIFALFIKEWLGCNDRRKNLQMGFIVLFLVIMWADSYLLGRATAMLFITMAAILFSSNMILKNNQNMDKVFK